MAARGNILLVANWASGVGYAWWLMENFWVEISQRFGGDGCRVFLIYPQLDELPPSIAAADIDVFELDFHDRSADNQARLMDFIREHSIRHLYLSDAAEYSWQYLKLRRAGVRSIAVHDHTPGDRTVARGLRKIIKSLVHRLPLVCADRFIAVSDFVFDRFIDVSCIPRDKCAVAANGIVPIDLRQADPAYARREFGIAADSTIVVSCSRASYYKGIDLFVRSAHSMVHERGRTDLVFLFCGDGPDLQDFENLARELQLGDRMIFAGRRQDVRDILPSCHIGFHTTHGEVGYSLSMLESMSAGLATIVPDLPSTSRATVHDENGLVYAHGDIGSACDAITACLHGPTRQRLAARAVSDVQQRYNITNTNRQLIAALDGVFA